MPKSLTFSNGDCITYTYDADGNKLRTVHKVGTETLTTDYAGNVVYENGTAERLLTEAGYVTLKDGKYHYFIQDHQGNNRVVVNEAGNVEETNHYYPFGGLFASSNSVQPYKYNGKELDNRNGLGWHDYGARFYDATLGRWNAVDPLSEQDYFMSPYAYCGNNPITRIDTNGKVWETIWDAASLSIGINSFWKNINDQQYGAAAFDAVGIAVDIVATSIPFVPGGASVAINGIRTSNKITNAAQATITGKNVEKTLETSRAARREVMRKEGIPTSLQPKSQSRNASGREYTYEVYSKKGGGKVLKSVNNKHWTEATKNNRIGKRERLK